MKQRILTDRDVRKFEVEGDLGHRFDRFVSDQPPCRNCRGAVDEKIPLDVALELNGKTGQARN